MSKYPAMRNAIYNGEVDEYLDELMRLIANRKTAKGREASYTLNAGDIIVISSSCKPKMLANAQVIFVGRDATRLKVELTRTYSAKWRAGSIIRIPVSLVGSVVKPDAVTDRSS